METVLHPVLLLVQQLLVHPVALRHLQRLWLLEPLALAQHPVVALQ